MINKLGALRQRRQAFAGLTRFNPIALFVFFVVLLGGLFISNALGELERGRSPYAFIVSLLIGLYLLFAIQIANQWEKAVVLRFGKFKRLEGPGMFWIVPLVDSIPTWIDQRVMVTSFSAEKTLTADTVPIDVDAVLFWVVWDAQKAALEVENYREAISWAAQTALRDIIGKMMLADILVGRERIDVDLQKIIDQRTTPWGVTVQSVEIRDIVIPAGLEDAMSRQAQAERERQARVILGESEK
ncbi:MAG TPA: slipin family protein, partial [Anaerolineae bacterium]